MPPLRAAAGVTGDVERLASGFEAFLDAVLEADVQRIIITDAPAVLGLARFTELDERYAFSAIVATLKAARAEGALAGRDPETLARLLLGALTRGGMLIANSPHPKRTRNAVSRACGNFSAGSSGRVRPTAPPDRTAGRSWLAGRAGSTAAARLVSETL